MSGSALELEGGEVSRALLDVQAERSRQVEVKGWTPAHDDEDEKGGGLALAAACYALKAAGVEAKRYWPWGENWIRPMPAREMLVRAAALLVAEIERRDRVAPGGAG